MDSIGSASLQNDVLGYTAQMLAFALDNRRCHARSAMTSCGLKPSCSYCSMTENSCKLFKISFGKSISRRTLKCESFDTMKVAFPAMAQSTNLLSSGSSFIRLNLKKVSISSTEGAFNRVWMTFEAIIEFVFCPIISSYSSRISFETQRVYLPSCKPRQTLK